MNNFKKMLNNSSIYISKNAPTILTGMNVIGVLSAVGLASKAAVDSYKEMEGKDLTKLEKAKIIGINYIPTVIMTGTAIFCGIESHRIDLKRGAAYAAAYSATKLAYDNFKDKAIEAIGEKKVKKIQEKVKTEKVENTPVNTSAPTIIEGRGNHLFFDNYSGRYFRADIEGVKRAINNMNAQLRSDVYVSLNDFYDCINEIALTPLEHIKAGNELGWNVDAFPIDVDVTTATIAPNGEPCIILDFDTPPKPEFDYFH